MPEHIIDARWLEPPEPMELTLAAIDHLKPGDHLRLLIHRKPHMLFSIVKEWGFNYQSHANDDGTFEILIWPREQAAPNGNANTS